MIEYQKSRLKTGLNVGVTIMNLLKATDSFNHKLRQAKLKAYGLSDNSITFMRAYLTNRLQGWKRNTRQKEILVRRTKRIFFVSMLFSSTSS